MAKEANDSSMNVREMILHFESQNGLPPSTKLQSSKRFSKSQTDLRKSSHLEDDNNITSAPEDLNMPELYLDAMAKKLRNYNVYSKELHKHYESELVSILHRIANIEGKDNATRKKKRELISALTNCFHVLTSKLPEDLSQSNEHKPQTLSNNEPLSLHRSGAYVEGSASIKSTTQTHVTEKNKKNEVSVKELKGLFEQNSSENEYRDGPNTSARGEKTPKVKRVKSCGDVRRYVVHQRIDSDFKREENIRVSERVSEIKRSINSSTDFRGRNNTGPSRFEKKNAEFGKVNKLEKSSPLGSNVSTNIHNGVNMSRNRARSDNDNALKSVSKIENSSPVGGSIRNGANMDTYRDKSEFFKALENVNKNKMDSTIRSNISTNISNEAKADHDTHKNEHVKVLENGNKTEKNLPFRNNIPANIQKGLSMKHNRNGNGNVKVIHNTNNEGNLDKKFKKNAYDSKEESIKLLEKSDIEKPPKFNVKQRAQQLVNTGVILRGRASDAPLKTLDRNLSPSSDITEAVVVVSGSSVIPPPPDIQPLLRSQGNPSTKGRLSGK